jgi:toxin YoeB
MKNKLCWHPLAWEDYLYWQANDKKMLAKINTIIKAIDREPFTGIAKPEPLKHVLQGFWSRRINKEHRIVYSVKDKTLTVLSCRYHYSEPRKK